MPFFPPQINPAVQGWKEEANALPEPQEGGHVLSFLANLLAPQLNRAYGRAVEGKYQDQPWQTIAADALVPDQGAAEGVGQAMGMNAPITAGMIRMGGKEFPNAYLHRALGNPEELDWLANLFQKGRSTQKPTSAVTPSVMSTFGSEPYGLMFNVNEPGQIAQAGYADLWTRSRPGGLTKAEMQLQRWADKKGEEGPEFTGKLGTMYNRIRNKLEDRGTQEWKSTMPEYEVNPTTEDLRRLFGKQRSEAYNNLGSTKIDPWTLTHNEIIPNIDRSMLAGVRLPLANKKGGGGDFLTNADFTSETIHDALIRALTDFAEQQRVPIFRWPAEMTQAQQLKGLEDPFAGKWGYPPGRKDYITSSMLPKIFGITELP